MHLRQIICLTLFIGLLGLSSAIAQENENEYKFDEGARNLEIQMLPLAGSVSIDGIRFRYFNSDNTALRLNAAIRYNRSTSIHLDGEDGDEEFTTANSRFAIDLRPGYEMHFSGTDRLSPYVGGELVIGFQTTRLYQEFYDGDDGTNERTIKNGVHEGLGNGHALPGYFRIGANAVAGFDFYMAKNFYLGAEINYGLGYTTFLDASVEADGTDAFEDFHDDLEDDPKGGSFAFQPGMSGFDVPQIEGLEGLGLDLSAIGTIRIGYNF